MATRNSSRPRRPGPAGPALPLGEHPVDTGTAAVVPDDDGRGGWTLHVNGVPSSHVDPGDPTRLDFEYMRWTDAALGAALPDRTADPGPRVVHLGGGAATLARAWAVTRPTARQVVVELDAALLDLVRRACGMRSTSRLRLRDGEARAVLTTMPGASADVVVRDAFSHDRVPRHLTTTGFVDEVHRVLSPGGVYLANLADRAPLALARAEAATARTRFAHVVMIAEPAQWHGRRWGNLVLAASDSPFDLAALDRALACDAVRAKALDDAETARFCAGHGPLEDQAPPGR